MKRLGKVVVAMAAAVALIAVASPAHAEDIVWSGQGTDNGVCSNIQFDPSVPAGSQIWQINLNPVTNPSSARLTASFSDGTNVADKAPDSAQGANAQFLVTTSLGATLQSASATFESHQGNTQITVSHCRVGEEKKEEKKEEEIKKVEVVEEVEKVDVVEEVEVVTEVVEAEVAVPVAVQPALTG